MADIVDDDLLDEVEVSQEDLQSIGNLATQQMKLEAELDELEENVKAKKKELFRVQQNLLPEALQAAGMVEFRMQNGARVKLKSDMSVSVPAAKKGDVCDWLREEGYGAIIKNELTVAIDKGKDNSVAEMIAHVEELGFEYSRSENFATGTLKSLLKEQLEEGDLNKPLEFFGAYPWTKAEIKR